MNPGWIAVVGVALTAIATIIVGLRTASLSRQASWETARAAPYESLATRVDKLENQVGTLREKVEQFERREFRLVQYIRALWQWITNGKGGTPPVIPTDLHDILPLHEWAWTPPDDGQPENIARH